MPSQKYTLTTIVWWLVDHCLQNGVEFSNQVFSKDTLSKRHFSQGDPKFSLGKSFWSLEKNTRFSSNFMFQKKCKIVFESELHLLKENITQIRLLFEIVYFKSFH